MDIVLGTSYSFCQMGQRENQEDARYPDSDQLTAEQRYFVVCDGVGGAACGEVASQVVSKEFGTTLADTDFSKDFSNDDFLAALNKAYDALDKAANSKSHSMGTTLTFACFHAGGCTLAHIGDSGIFQIRPNTGLIYKSDAHSMVNQLVHSGIITPEDAIDHAQRNIITRCMQPTTSDQVRSMATVVRTSDIEEGDYFLLCTDGVTESVSNDQLVDILCCPDSDKEKMEQIRSLCSNSDDNNTAILIHVKIVQRQKEQPIPEGDYATAIGHNFVVEDMESVKTSKSNNSMWKKIVHLFN